jgi:hypothetical protein
MGIEPTAWGLIPESGNRCPQLRTDIEILPSSTFALYAGAMKTASVVVIRCATPDCEWGFPMPDLGELAFGACYSDFLKHCINIHGQKRNSVSESFVFLDLEKWTLTLLK